MTFKIWGAEDAVRTGGSIDRDVVTMLPNGGYVATWRENQKIAFQLYDGNGAKLGDAHFVANSTFAQQFSDVLAFDSDGSFAITWTEDHGSTGRTLLSQKFHFDGSADGDAAVLNTATQTDGAQMSANSQGGWATAYLEHVGTTNTIRLTQFDGSGVPGTTVSVASPSAADKPDVAWLGGTKHVVSYVSNLSPATISFNIVDGSSVGDTISVSNAVAADVVALKNPDGTPTGKFAVVTDMGATGVQAQFYDANGNALKDSSNNPIVTTIAGAKPNSDFDCVGVTALKSGGFAVAYVAADGADLGDVFVKVVGADGAAGQAIKLNARAAVDGPGAQKAPSISEMADGRLSVTWHDPTLGNGLVSTTVVDARTSKITVTGTMHSDVYAPSEYSGDSLDGGAGFDTLTFKGTTTGGVAVDLVHGNGSAGDAAGDTYTSFEKVIGTSFNDTLSGGADHVLVGGAGNDTYNVSASNTVIDESGGGMDQVYASVSYVLSAGIENLFATGSDAINLTGDASDNTVVGNEAANQLQGQGGKDVLRGNGGNDVLSGGDGNDALYGGAGVDNLDGGNGDDVLDGGAGADVMNGGIGNDTYYIDDANDRVTDSGGVDTVVVSVDYDLGKLVGIENITGSGAGKITLRGTSGNNTITGSNDGPDILHGGAGNDILSGQGGNDVLYGEVGRDILNGGAGRDAFVFDTPLSKSKAVNKANIDKIADYNVKDDSIYLENKVFKALGKAGSLEHPKALAKGFFHVGAKAHDANDHVIYNKKTGALYYDADGTGHQAQVQIASLSKNLKIDFHDFFVI